LSKTTLKRKPERNILEVCRELRKRGRRSKMRKEPKKRHSQEVRKQMELREFSRIEYIKKKREEKDSVMSKT
jgi:hypothetical protein